MTDLHCHILPDMDDGAQNEEISLALLQKEYKGGVRQVMLTSHFYPDRMTLDSFHTKRRYSFERLKRSIATKGGFDCLKLKLGAEVRFSPALAEMDVRKLCFEGTDYLLLELPFLQRPYLLKETLYKLQSMGITPILAHVERYGYLMEDLRELYDWIAAGGYAQVNAETILNADQTGKTAVRLIQWNLVQIIASDAHSLNRRPPNMSEGLDYISEIYGDQLADTLEENSDRIFNGEYIDTTDAYCPKKILGKCR